MFTRDPDAERATSAARTLLELRRRLTDRDLGSAAQTVDSALSVVAGFLADSDCPPRAADTDALITVLTAGVRHVIAER